MEKFSCLHVSNVRRQNTVDHVEVATCVDEKSHGPCGLIFLHEIKNNKSRRKKERKLTYSINVNQSVKIASRSKAPEKEFGSSQSRIGGQIKSSNGNKGQDIFQIILVAPSDALNIIAGLHLNPAVILWTGEGLKHSIQK